MYLRLQRNSVFPLFTVRLARLRLSGSEGVLTGEKSDDSLACPQSDPVTLLHPKLSFASQLKDPALAKFALALDPLSSTIYTSGSRKGDNGS